MAVSFSTKKRKKWKQRFFLFVCLLLLLLLTTGALILVLQHLVSSSSTPGFFSSIDTMKVSRDTVHQPLSQKEINEIVALSAKVQASYITVDTHWDYPAYIKRWITAIRAGGRHVWFRIHPNQWENDNGTTGIMNLEAYKQSEEAFILAHPDFFQAGDILDPCPEPEQGLYWSATYGPRWTYNAPNDATRSYNRFLRETSDTADRAFQRLGIQGVITTVRSTNSFFPSHRGVLEEATVKRFGRITVDSYPEHALTDPVAAARSRLNELDTIERLWHVPIVIGEMGYSNAMPVSDQAQQEVLKAEFAAIERLNYVSGLNYWVGAGSDTAGGYTYIFRRTAQGWSARPAAQELTAFFRYCQTRS